jgi:hypothetical protein
MRELYEAGGVLLPAGWVADASQRRGFTGVDDPTVMGAAVAVNDLWFVPNPLIPPPPAPPITWRGAIAVGGTHYDIPTTGAVVYVDGSGSDTAAGTADAPFRTVAHAVSVLATSGGTVIVRAGVYHSSLTRASGGAMVTVQAYPGEAVWFDGSVVVTTWTASGSVWVHTGVPTQFARSGGVGWSATALQALGGDSYADLSDQVFIDGVPLKQVADGTTPGAGQFSVNYTANTITIGSSPVGHEVRVSDLRSLCVASGPLSWKGVGVRCYAPDYTNAVGAPFYYGGTSGGSLFENVVIEHSAMSALNLNKPNITVRNCTLQTNTWNGLMGTKCDALAVLSNKVIGNNTGLLKPQPQTGAVKITFCNGLILDNNQVSDNNGGNGLWIDADVIAFQISNNLITGNHNAALVIEESDGGTDDGTATGTPVRAVIAGNRISGAVFGCYIDVSGDIDFYNNELKQCKTIYITVQNDRAYSASGRIFPQSVNPWSVRNVTLANNVFGPGTPTSRVRYFDQLAPNSADALGGKMLTNLFMDTTGALIQWGTGTNTYASYSTPAAAQAAHPTTLVGNVQGATMADSAATPMPANVAAALGVPAGTQKIGPYISATAS